MPSYIFSRKYKKERVKIKRSSAAVVISGLIVKASPYSIFTLSRQYVDLVARKRSLDM